LNFSLNINVVLGLEMTCYYKLNYKKIKIINKKGDKNLYG